MNPDPIKLVFSETKNAWTAFDLQNNELGSDLTSISTRGLTITLLGTANDGDEITINPSNNFSRDMEVCSEKSQKT